jgi:uncharacterized protein (TIGR03435 family)
VKKINPYGTTLPRCAKLRQDEVMRGFAALCAASVLAAQQAPAPDAPKFEVVSIRVVPPNAPQRVLEPGFTPVLPGGQYVDSRTTLFLMIAIAYNIKTPSLQLSGLPKWAQDRSFAVAAKPAADFPALPPAGNFEQVRAMLRAMLEDRFHLQLHTEERQERILSLEVAKGGIKIKEVDAPVPPVQEGPVGAAVGDDGGRIIGQKSTMAGVAHTLAIFIKRPVVDNTGLKGYYDFDFRWTAAEGLGPDGIGLLRSAVEDRLGLRIRTITGPVMYWVVDHVEPPTEN